MSIVQEEVRQRVIAFYTTKVENHIGYLLSGSLGLAALLTNIGGASQLLPPMIRSDLLIILGLVTAYILIRTFYWSSLQGTITRVKPTPEDKIPKFVGCEYNLYWAYQVASIDCATGKAPYGKDPVKHLVYVSNQKKWLIFGLILLGLAIHLESNTLSSFFEWILQFHY